MGFTTNIAISNDFWHEIAKDPEAFVDAIGTMMNYGMSSPLMTMIDRRSGKDPWDRDRGFGHYKTPQGVTVFKARHYDDPQVIINTYGSHQIDAEEIPGAIDYGWLDEAKGNEQHAEAIAFELARLAKQIRNSVKDAKKRRAEDTEGGPYPSRDKRLDRISRFSE